MAQSITVKSIIKQIEDGNIRDALKVLDKKNIELIRKNGMKIVISCYNVCKSPTDKLCGSDVMSLLNLVVENIVEPTEFDLNQYYPLVFYIIKFIIVKIDANILNNLETLVNPQFAPEELLNKPLQVYKNVVGLLYNRLYKLCVEDEDKSIAIKLAIVVSNLNRKVMKTELFLDNAVNCVRCLNAGKLSLEDCEKYYLHVFNLVQLNVYTNEVCGKLLALMNAILSCCSTENYIQMEKVLTKIIKLVPSNGTKNYVPIMKMFSFLIMVAADTPKHEAEFKNVKEQMSYLKRVMERTVFLEMCGIIQSKLNVIINYNVMHKEQWSNMKENMQIIILETLLEVGKQMINLPCNCSCNSKTNIYNFSVFGYMILTIILNHFKKVNKVQESFKTLVFSFMRHMKVFNYSGLASKCEKAKSHWQTYLKKNLYNVGIYLHQNKDQGCIEIFNSVITHTFSLEGFIIESTTLEQAISLLAYNLQAYKEYEACMEISALYMYLYEKKDDYVQNSWIKSKSALRENDLIQQTTIVAVLNTFRTYIPTYNVRVDLNKLCSKKLLELELDMYKSNWKSKVPMMSAFKELCAVTDLKSSVLTALKVFGNCDFTVHKDVCRILKKLVETYEVEVNKEDPSIESKINLAHLYYVYFTFYLRIKMMNNVELVEKELLAQNELDAKSKNLDPLDRTDVVTVYENLKLENYLKIVKCLQQCMKLLSEIVENHASKAAENPNLFRLLVKVSHDYRLHNHTALSLKALVYALKICNLQSPKNHLQIVECISLIIESCDVFKTSIQKLVEEGDGYIKTLSHDSTTKKIIIQYHISKSKAFMYKDYRLSYAHFKVAEEMLNDLGPDEMCLQKLQLLILYSKFIMFPCSMRLIDHKQHTPHKFVEAIRILRHKDFDEQVPGNSFALSLKFEVYEEILRFSHNCGIPRQVRSYGRLLLQLSQEMILPMQNLKFLYYMANADLRSKNRDDCLVKINGMANILCLPKMSVSSPLKFEHSKPNKVIDDMNSVIERMQGLIVGVTREARLSPTSPGLIAEGFRFPSHLKHVDACDCFYCTSLDYHKFILAKTRLDVVVNLCVSNVELTKDHIIGGLKIYEYYKNQYGSWANKTMNILGKNYNDFVLEFEDNFIEPYVELMYDYSVFLVKSQDNINALDINLQILNLLYPKKLKYIHLYGKALYQRINLLSLNEVKVPEPTNLLTVSPQNNPINSPVTPTYNKDVMPSNQLTIQPAHKSKSQRLPRPTKLNLSPNVEHAPEVKKKIVAKEPKTPAPSIRVYSSPSVAEVKKTIEPSCSKASTKSLTSNRKKVTVVSTKAACSEMDLQLKNKTKLLTQRLKSGPSRIVNKENNADAKKPSASTKEEKKGPPSVNSGLLSSIENNGTGRTTRSSRLKK